MYFAFSAFQISTNYVFIFYWLLCGDVSLKIIKIYTYKADSSSAKNVLQVVQLNCLNNGWVLIKIIDHNP